MTSLMVLILSILGLMPVIMPLSMLLICRSKPGCVAYSRARMPLLMVTMIGIVAGTVLIHLVTSEFFETLFSAGLALSPFWVVWILGFFCESKLSQRLLLVSSISYIFWFTFLYREVFCRLLAPETAFMIVGIYSLPVMLPLWIVAFLKRGTKPIAI